MQHATTRIGSMLDERYVLVGLRAAGTAADEWDAVDTLLHRAVIISWAAPRAHGEVSLLDAGPHAAHLPETDGDPTLAMPIPVSDGRLVLDGGVHDERAYLVLEPDEEGLRAAPHDAHLDDTLVQGAGWAAASTGATMRPHDDVGGPVTEPTGVVPEGPREIEDPTIVDGRPFALRGAAVDHDHDHGDAAARGDDRWRGATTSAVAPATVVAGAETSPPALGTDREETPPKARRRHPAAVVLAIIGAAGLLLVAALVVLALTAPRELVPDSTTIDERPSTTVTPTTASPPPPTTQALVPSRPAPTRAPTTTKATSTTAPTTTAPEPPTTTEPPAPPTTAPVAPPITLPVTTAAPPTTAPPTTIPAPATPAGSPSTVTPGPAA
jgi:hypothetical protein